MSNGGAVGVGAVMADRHRVTIRRRFNDLRRRAPWRPVERAA